MVLELVERRLAARLHERAVERCTRLEREPRFEIAAVIFRNRVETGQHHPLDADRLAFLDVDLQPDRLLIVAQPHVERFDPGVWEATVPIEGDDALEVCLELLAAEVLPRSPGTFGLSVVEITARSCLAETALFPLKERSLTSMPASCSSLQATEVMPSETMISGMSGRSAMRVARRSTMTAAGRG